MQYRNTRRRERYESSRHSNPYVRRHTSERKHILFTSAIVTGMILLVFVMLIFITPSRIRAEKREVPSGTKYYTSYQIQAGDSLWSISEKYSSDTYESRLAYVDEVCRINHLRDQDEIYAGQKICIPYYADHP